MSRLTSKEPVSAVGEAEQRGERLGEGDASTQATAGQDERDHALWMAPGEFKDRAASRRKPDQDGAIDTQVLKEHRVGIRLGGRSRAVRQVEPK